MKILTVLTQPKQEEKRTLAQEAEYLRRLIGIPEETDIFDNSKAMQVDNTSSISE